MHSLSIGQFHKLTVYQQKTPNKEKLNSTLTGVDF
jgi:hypothetical protein